MLKTGQVPMDVNAMPGLVEDVSDAEELDAEGGINALQSGDMCFFCKKPGHQKRDCRKFEEWKKKNPHKKPGGETLAVLIPDPQFCVTIAGKTCIFHGNAERKGEIREGEEMVVLEVDRWQIWQNLWQLCRRF